ncbi:hypothetical protein [Amycolatopsis pigmentata]|uniref:Uncharacterized protein n=1 Tax=Amycolatopsis pigmentata TaxID=450801 RepID=A0ABW5FIG5_9PSEU
MPSVVAASTDEVLEACAAVDTSGEQPSMGPRISAAPPPRVQRHPDHRDRMSDG